MEEPRDGTGGDAQVSCRATPRDVAQSGSAPEWGSGGRGFKSRRPDWLKSKPHIDFGCGAFSSVAPRVVSVVVSLPVTQRLTIRCFGCNTSCRAVLATGCWLDRSNDSSLFHLRLPQCPAPLAIRFVRPPPANPEPDRLSTS